MNLISFDFYQRDILLLLVPKEKSNLNVETFSINWKFKDPLPYYQSFILYPASFIIHVKNS